MKRLLATIVLMTLVVSVASSQPRIKDLADVEGINETPLIGYGLVVGLEGTGDSRQALFTNQTLRNMLDRFGISVESDRVRTRNIAGVMITANLPVFTRPGQKADVNVSSLGDAKSLNGGILLLSPLIDPGGEVYGVAQGPVSTGGFAIFSGESTVKQNSTSVGRVPSGLTVEKVPDANLEAFSEVRYTLHEPDVTTATRIADAINQTLGQDVATAQDPVSVVVAIPDGWPGGAMGMIAQTEQLAVIPDVYAKVVINERTGTVVVGANVMLSSVAVTHGPLSITIASTPSVSQPNAFSGGQTVQQNMTQIQVQQNGTQLTVLEESTNVGDVAQALNSLGVLPLDIIAIFQALKTAGALQAELVII